MAYSRPHPWAYAMDCHAIPITRSPPFLSLLCIVLGGTAQPYQH